MAENMNKSEYLVEVNDLKQYFPVKTGFFSSTPLKAVDGVSFNIKPGETLGLVGESGCGKTTVGRSLLRLYQPTGGEFKFDGELVTDKNIHALRKEMQMVFQDPYSSLNPRMTVEDIIGEPLDVHKLYTTKQDRHDKIMHLMELVGLNAEHATRYAHEFSGGQRQRIGIARALAVDPKFIVCDEPVSALDASPIHPYTLSLLSAVPIPDPNTARASHRIVLEGDVPSPLHMPSGCPFRTRCRYATEQCSAECPSLTDRGNGHMVACWNK